MTPEDERRSRRVEPYQQQHQSTLKNTYTCTLQKTCLYNCLNYQIFDELNQISRINDVQADKGRGNSGLLAYNQERLDLVRPVYWMPTSIWAARWDNHRSIDQAITYKLGKAVPTFHLTFHPMKNEQQKILFLSNWTI